MIKSVTFPSKGTGYIYSTLSKPKKPSKMERAYMEFRVYDKLSHHAWDIDSFSLNEEGQALLEKDLKQYKEDLAYYKEHKDEFICPAASLLVGKTFNFAHDKINVLFAPNGAGKSTIIKAIAGAVNTTDGFSQLFDYGFRTYEDVCLNKQENSASIDWSGNAVYYYNFEHAYRNASIAGSLVGSLMASNVGEELNYIMTKNRVSSGQHNTMLINQLLKIASKHYCLKDILYGIEHNDDSWSAGHIEQQMKALRPLPDFDKEGPITMLMDEIDKSYDIETCYSVYHDILPYILKTFGTQFIVVSHNMFMLSDKVCDPSIYNIIPLDKDYYESVKKIVSENF